MRLAVYKDMTVKIRRGLWLECFQLAQLVERLTVNQNVAGSSPALGAKIPPLSGMIIDSNGSVFCKGVSTLLRSYFGLIEGVAKSSNIAWAEPTTSFQS